MSKYYKVFVSFVVVCLTISPLSSLAQNPIQVSGRPSRGEQKIVVSAGLGELGTVTANRTTEVVACNPQTCGSTVPKMEQNALAVASGLQPAIVTNKDFKAGGNITVTLLGEGVASISNSTGQLVKIENLENNYWVFDQMDSVRITDADQPEQQLFDGPTKKRMYEGKLAEFGNTSPMMYISIAEGQGLTISLQAKRGRQLALNIIHTSDAEPVVTQPEGATTQVGGNVVRNNDPSFANCVNARAIRFLSPKEYFNLESHLRLTLNRMIYFPNTSAGSMSEVFGNLQLVQQALTGQFGYGQFGEFSEHTVALWMSMNRAGSQADLIGLRYTQLGCLGVDVGQQKFMVGGTEQTITSQMTFQDFIALIRAIRSGDDTAKQFVVQTLKGLEARY